MQSVDRHPVAIKKFPAVPAQRSFVPWTDALCARLLGSRRGVIGTRLLNLNDVDSDHPEPMVQDIRPGGTGGEPSAGRSASSTSPFFWSCPTVTIVAAISREAAPTRLA